VIYPTAREEMEQDMLNKGKKSISVLLAIAMIFSVMLSTSAKENDMLQEVELDVVGFEYPIFPKDEEWALLNHGERVLALQIPDDVLGNMGTGELVEVVLAYPLFSDMMFYNSYQQGLEIIAATFNGLEELLSREDAGTHLLANYANFNVGQVMRMRSEYERFETFLDLIFLETVLAQLSVIENMSETELDVLSILAHDKYLTRLNNIGASVSLTTSAYYESIAEQQTQSSQPRNTSMTVHTPRGTAVTVINVSNTDAAYANRANIKTYIETNYPGTQVVGDATNRYNCHSYAWHSQSQTRLNGVWMNNPNAYMTDGSYS